MPAQLTWAQTAALNPRERICLGCGSELAIRLARLGSLRCDDCRAAPSASDLDI